MDQHASMTEICGFLVNENESVYSGQIGGRVVDGGDGQHCGPYFGPYAANGCGTLTSSTTGHVAAWYVPYLFRADLFWMTRVHGVHVCAHHGFCVSLQPRHGPHLFFDGALIGLVQPKENDLDAFSDASDGCPHDHLFDVPLTLAAHFDH
jgi:hypothetical protein